MTISEIRKSLKKCLDLRHKKRKTVPYKDLDICLYVVEEYLDMANKINIAMEVE